MELVTRNQHVYRYAFLIELKDGYTYDNVDYSEVVCHLGAFVRITDAILKVIDGRVVVLEYTKQRRMSNVLIDMTACTLKKIKVRDMISYLPSSI